MSNLPRPTGSGGAVALPAQATGVLEWLRGLVDVVGPFATIGGILIAWEVAAQLELVIPFLLPPL
jgi:hypothetical protein